jgi:hypothetical protein
MIDRLDSERWWVQVVDGILETVFNVVLAEKSAVMHFRGVEMDPNIRFMRQ